MNPLQPLMALLDQTERERDVARVEVHRLMQVAESAKTQLEALFVYRRDYEQRFTEKFSKEGGMELMHCYRGFMDRLAQAIDHQQHVVDQSIEREGHARIALQQHEVRVASVRKLIERREHELRLSADRQEQKQTDEVAARAGWVRQNLLNSDGVRVV